MAQWYETLFSNYAERYDHEVFVRGTEGECDFIEDELKHNKELRIIDVGCGTGRHCIELTKRGYRVTGIDLSASQLERARSKARAVGLKIDFQQCDARDLPYVSEFDAAIMICEGGFPLMETDEMNYAILKSVARSLKPSAKFILTTLNGLYPLFNAADSDEGSDASSGFDLMTFRDHNTLTFIDDDGQEFQVDCNERYYVPSEMTWLLKSLGFSRIDIFGAQLGAFSRQDELTVDDLEMLVIAER